MVLSMETPLVEGEENNRVLVLRMVPSSRDTLTIMKTLNTTHKQTSIASYFVSAVRPQNSQNLAWLGINRVERESSEKNEDEHRQPFRRQFTVRSKYIQELIG